MQVFCTRDEPGRTQNGSVVGILLRLSTNRATFVLKFGALTHTSTVWPARNTRWRLLSEAMIVAAPRRTLPALSVLLVNGHFGLPRQMIRAFQPARELLRDLQRGQPQHGAAGAPTC